MSTPFKLHVITPEKNFFDEDTTQLIIRTDDGDIGVLHGHTSYVAGLPAGPLKIKLANGAFRIAAISNGMVKISKEKTTIIVDAAEWADEIDVARAKQAEEAARERLKQQSSGQEFERADLKLKRALNRLNVSDMK